MQLGFNVVVIIFIIDALIPILQHSDECFVFAVFLVFFSRMKFFCQKLWERLSNKQLFSFLFLS